MEMDQDDEEYRELSREYLSNASKGHRAFIVQPYIKWGSGKVTNTTPELQLDEAEALVKTLPDWSVVDKICVPLLTLQKSKLFGKGNFEKLRTLFHSNRNINALFVSKNILRPIQVKELQVSFANLQINHINLKISQYEDIKKQYDNVNISHKNISIYHFFTYCIHE